MRLLILGGTIFLGRHLVASALAHGHEVTLFNRGRNPNLYPGVEELLGDRHHDLSALHGRRWDAVIDTSGYVPRVVRASAELLANAVDHYTFISSISVYADHGQTGIDENTAVGILADESVEEITGESYGPLKALCEQAAEAAMPGRVFNVRAGLIVGPYDPSDRFTYWPWRIQQGGDILAPEPRTAPEQFIDGRDLAGWIIRMVEARQTGIYNATGPDYPLTMGHLLQTCVDVSRNNAQLMWVHEQFLLDQGVGPWMELPLWIPGTAYAGMSQVSIARALADGLTFRPLADTVRDTIDWAATRPADHEWRAGLKPEREAALLQEWHARQK
jgi:2'-hydroxyisoflavone reductase